MTATYTAACASATMIVLMSRATSMCVSEAAEPGEILNKHSPVLTTHNLLAVTRAAKLLQQSLHHTPRMQSSNQHITRASSNHHITNANSNHRITHASSNHHITHASSKQQPSHHTCMPHRINPSKAAENASRILPSPLQHPLNCVIIEQCNTH